jgi:hypothetical protein
MLPLLFIYLCNVLKILLVTQTIKIQLTVNNELEIMFVAQLKILFWHWPEGSEQNLRRTLGSSVCCLCLNCEPLKYKSYTLMLEPTCMVQDL